MRFWLLSSRVRRTIAGVGLAAMVMTTGGCLFGPKESLLEKGESVDSGRRVFDTYFQEVSELRDEVGELDSDLFPLRQPLVEHMDLSIDASLPKLLDETRKRADKLKDYGVAMSLELSPEPTVLKEEGKLEQDADEAGLAVAIQESAVRAMVTFKKYQQLLSRAAELESQRSELANRIDRLPPNYDRRELIETEIVAAGRVLADAERKLLRDTRTVAHFLVGLTSATDTGAAESRAKKCEEALIVYKEQQENKTKKRQGRRRWAGRRGAGRRPAPRPRPQPKPKPAPAGGDFEM